MKTNSKFIIRLCLFIIFVIFSIFYFTSKYKVEQFCKLLDAPINGALPVGEIIKNLRLDQTVEIKKIRQVSKKWLNSFFCVEILMANYSNRENEGRILIGIVLDGNVYNLTINAEDVQDNVYQRCIFNNVTLSDVYKANNLQILIEGIDSVKNKAVTAWSTSDVSAGKLITENRKLKERSLCFRIGFINESHQKKRNSIVLSIITLSMIFILVFQVNNEPKKQSEAFKE